MSLVLLESQFILLTTSWCSRSVRLGSRLKNSRFICIFNKNHYCWWWWSKWWRSTRTLTLVWFSWRKNLIRRKLGHLRICPPRLHWFAILLRILIIIQFMYRFALDMLPWLWTAKTLSRLQAFSEIPCIRFSSTWTRTKLMLLQFLITFAVHGIFYWASLFAVEVMA
jgi:hypothetical protein